MGAIRERLAVAELHPDRARHSPLCGTPLARLETRVVLSTLLKRTTHVALDPDRPQHWAESIWIRRHERLPLVVEPY